MRLTRARRWILACSAAAAALAGLAFAGPPAVPATPIAPSALVAAKPFVLGTPFVFRWSADRPLVDRGWLLVLDADPALLWPRETAQPVLYVGDRTAMIGHVSAGDGRIVALVPGHLDPSATPIWFGEPELPERVDGTRIERERAAAQAAGIAAFPDAVFERARRVGGETARVETWFELDAIARDLAAGAR